MVRNILASFVAVIGLVALYLIWTPAKSSRPARPPATAPSLKIAPTSDALSFARLGKQTIAVSSYANGRITGLPIGNSGEDAISLVNRLGYDGVRALIAAGSTPVTADVADLAVPVDLRDQHIAAGTNYREHAEEATVDGGPFLFVKYVTPTSSRASVAAGDALLDYEVELCLVPLAPARTDQAATGGLMLCNDVTDRATLMRNVDPERPESGKGFTSGKSAPGYLPVGELFIVPRDLDRFVSGVTLQLSVNGQERQRTEAKMWIWDLTRILAEAGAMRGREWAYWGGTARLPFDADGKVPARTLILAGTPGGTVFAGIDARAIGRGLVKWLAGGWGTSFTTHVIESQIALEKQQQRYLQPGDRMTIQVDRLGSLDNLIVK
jgi:2-keto-4-pentenoate hydratase/2-oxohepta-3-ene-1,7-dioic acid hydratase in catechol pathway